MLREAANDPQKREKTKQLIVDRLATSKLRPVVARVVPSEVVVEGHRCPESNQRVYHQ